MKPVEFFKIHRKVQCLCDQKWMTFTQCDELSDRVNLPMVQPIQELP